MFALRPCYALAVCAFILSWQSVPLALAINEFQKLEALDAANNDGFGYAVGLSGPGAVVGAWKDDDRGLDSGSAYVFHRAVGGAWTQLDKLTASNTAPGDAFGAAVAMSGNTAIVGAPFHDDVGSAYIFAAGSGGDWIEVDTLIADDVAPGDQFGFSVAISGNRAIVGAWMDGGGIGSAYIFRNNGTGVWNQVDKVTAIDSEANHRFGYSVAIHGKRALVGAPFDGEAAPLGGAAYVFQEDDFGNWNQFDKITADDASVGAQLGTSVALDATRAIAGAVGESSSGAFAGAAYLFQSTGGNWEQVDKLTASDAAAGDRFGQSVALGDNFAAVGAYQDNNGTPSAGSAYTFADNGDMDWVQTAKLTASDKQAGDALGFAIAASGSTALVGAPLSNNGTDSGAAYLFTAPNGITGDFNGDGAVDAADYTVWRDTRDRTGPDLAADANGDDVVNQADYQLWKENFAVTSASGQGASIGAVPEPSSAVLFCLVASLSAISRSVRRRRR